MGHRESVEIYYHSTGKLFNDKTQNGCQITKCSENLAVIQA